jgi:hypothetical protein
MEETDWESYGTGRYEKCANCMVHCGYEPTAVTETVSHPLRALKVWLKGVDTEAPMAREIDLSNQRPAEYIFENMVKRFMEDVPADAARAKGSEERGREKRGTERSDAA